MNNAEHRRNLQISAMHDMPLLEHVLAFDDLTPPERTSFMEMRSEIVTHQRACLSRKQRSWLEDVAGRHKPSKNGFKKMALDMGWTEEEFKVWANGRKWEVP